MLSKAGIAVGLTLLPFHAVALHKSRQLAGKPEAEEYDGDLQKLVDKFRDKGLVPPAPELPELPEQSEEEKNATELKTVPTQRPHRRWGRLAPANPNLRNAATYWGHITCQDPHEIDIGIRMKVNQYPGDITFQVSPWQYLPFQFFGNKRDPLGVQYCRAVTTCTAEYTLTVDSPNATNYTFDSNPEHLSASTGNHVMYDQCEWPTIGLSGYFKSDLEFLGDLTLTGTFPHQRKMFKARSDLGQDTQMTPLCVAMENAIKGDGSDPTVGGYLSCSKFWLRKCVDTEPQGHEFAVYMIKTEAQTNGDNPEPRISLLAQNYSQNMLHNPAMFAATQTTRTDQIVTVVYMPPTMLAIDTYLFGLKTLGGSFEIILDPGLMSAHHQRKMVSSFVLSELGKLTGVDDIVSQYTAMTSFCSGSSYPNHMFAQWSFSCGIDPSDESVAAMGTEEERLYGFKERMKAYGHSRVLVYAHEYLFSDAGLGTLRGGTVESIEVRVLSANNHWRKTSDPHCWDGTP